MKHRRLGILVALLALALCAIPFHRKIRSVVISSVQIIKGRKTVAERLAQFEEPVKARLAAPLANAGLDYPPRKLTLIGLKDEQVLEVWGANADGRHRLLKIYPILGTSGTLGPKLREGDRQVPEGLYAVESLNPNSSFHLALRIGYPNEFDRKKALMDGRDNPGSDIMIHGSAVSIGCLAMGDSAAEELFVLAARTGLENIAVILSPVDFRRRKLPRDGLMLPPWSAELNTDIEGALAKFNGAGVRTTE